jgi:hypothetical protein
VRAARAVRAAAEAGCWQAAAWRLERRWPERWSRTRALFADVLKRLKELERRR